MMRLPNQAVLTLMVRDAAQLRQLHTYHLDSLTSRLAGYINQAEQAAKNSPTDQVTMEFYPDKDLPGKNLPEQIRITTRKKNPNTNRVDVVLNKAFGMQVSTGPDGEKSYKLGEDKEASRARHARRDSTRAKQQNESNNTNLIFDLGLNALVSQKPHLGAAGNLQRVDLRPEGSRYVNIGFNNRQRLGGKRSPLSLIFGVDAGLQQLHAERQRQMGEPGRLHPGNPAGRWPRPAENQAGNHLPQPARDVPAGAARLAPQAHLHPGRGRIRGLPHQDLDQAQVHRGWRNHQDDRDDGRYNLENRPLWGAGHSSATAALEPVCQVPHEQPV
jgi:hypothetical protein